MKRIICGLALVVALAGVAAATALAAGGKGSQTLMASCTTAGNVTVHASSGQSAWVSNTHYVVMSLTGTFTPVSGPSTTFTKVYGKKLGLKAVDTCQGSQTDASGTFSFTVTVAKTPSH